MNEKDQKKGEKETEKKKQRRNRLGPK